MLGQIVHNGDWDPTPHGVPNLLKNIDQGTTLHVQFKRVPVDPEKSDIFSFPVLYMSGQRDFQFSQTARKRLREYLDHGGTLIVDDVIGSSEFDSAFRREIKLLYPDHALTDLPADHALFHFVYNTTQVNLAPMAAQELGRDDRPAATEVIQIDGQLPVIYSPLSMSAGWEQLPRAYDMGYADTDAFEARGGECVYVCGIALEATALFSRDPKASRGLLGPAQTRPPCGSRLTGRLAGGNGSE